MTLRDIIIKTQKIATDNSPAILTAIGVTGTLTTAYLTGKASFKAATILDEAQLEKNGERYKTDDAPFVRLTTKEKAQLIWQLYIPAVITGTLTCTAVICANRIGSRRTAAMAAAFSLSEKAYDEYKEKVVEQIGKNKERRVRDEIAQDRVDANPPKNQAIIATGKGDILFMDSYSGRPFESTMEDVKAAQNDTNYLVLNDGYASLTDFYNKLGLSSTKISDDLGWNSDKLLELEFSTTMTDDERPCIVVDFRVAPIRNYFRTH